jgi:hypothetical protein
MIFKCSEFKLHGKYFDNLSKDVESNSIDEAAEHYLREKFKGIGYPRQYKFFIKNEDDEIIMFETVIDLNAEIKKTGILDLPS